MTAAFDRLSQVVADGAGWSDIPRVVFPHPLNPLPEQEIRAIAREKVRTIVGLLAERP
jgi:hypothetical protein